VVAAIRTVPWPSIYSEDGVDVVMPTDVGGIFERSAEFAVLWSVRPVDGVQLHCHFFVPEEIEFDLSPREVLGPQELDGIAEFVRLVGEATGKVVTLCPENAPDEPLVTYTPMERTFTWSQPPS
jgi:hypothetical protein